MALLWCDGFDQYGADESLMLDGLYAQVGMSLSTTQVRTGTRSLSGGGTFRWVLPASRTTVGQGMAVYLNVLPNVSDRVVLFQGRDGNNNDHLTVTVMTTGGLRIRRGGTGGTLLHETEPVLTAAAWHHVEIKCVFDDTNGEVEIRVNGVTVAAIDTVDTLNTADAACHQLVVGEAASTDSTLWVDDFFVWDDQGSRNNDFLGDHRVRLLLPSGDTAQADWEVVGPGSPAGPGYEAINDSVPDDDTSYIEADAINEISEFEFEDLPETVSTIAALMVVGRMRKTDAGDCNVQMGFVTGGSPVGEAMGSDRPITETYTYWADVIEDDPSAAAPWTRDAVNAARLKFERTS